MTASYEEKRKQRMEENKKRMEELNIHKLAQSLKLYSKPIIKRNPVKKVNTEPPRRSVRMADKTLPNYKIKERYIDIFAKDQSEYTFKQNNIFYRVLIKEVDRMYTANKAKELALSLGSKFPTIVRPMTRSIVTGSIVNFPGSFCKNHHLDHDDVFTIIDEENKEWQLNYLAKSYCLSAGWPKFCSAHQLVDGDALVFQLIKLNTLKVYIIRVNKVISSSYSDDDDGYITP